MSTSRPVNGSVIVLGITHLASIYANGNTNEVCIVPSENIAGHVHLYLENEELKDFRNDDVKIMEDLGFKYSPYDENGNDDYSFFSLSLLGDFYI